MTEFRPQIFSLPTPRSSISAKGLLARTLPRPEWTHEAHLAATTYLLLKRPDIDLDEELPGLIRATMRASAA